MKKYIKGKKYSTATALKCGCDEAPPFTRTLYRKRSGEFFLHCTDDAGESIIPLAYHEAKTWSGKYLTSTEHDAFFGDSKESTETVVLSISMQADKAGTIRREAAKAGMTLSAYIAMKCTE